MDFMDSTSFIDYEVELWSISPLILRSIALEHLCIVISPVSILRTEVDFWPENPSILGVISAGAITGQLGVSGRYPLSSLTLGDWIASLDGFARQNPSTKCSNVLAFCLVIFAEFSIAGGSRFRDTAHFVSLTLAELCNVPQKPQELVFRLLLF